LVNTRSIKDDDVLVTLVGSLINCSKLYNALRNINFVALEPFGDLIILQFMSPITINSSLESKAYFQHHIY
jgi:hypothetical protein